MLFLCSFLSLHKKKKKTPHANYLLLLCSEFQYRKLLWYIFFCRWNFRLLQKPIIKLPTRPNLIFLKHFYSFTWKITPRPSILIFIGFDIIANKFPCPNVYTYFSKNVNLLGSKDCTKPWLVLRSGELQSIPMEILVNFLVSQARYYIILSDPIGKENNNENEVILDLLLAFQK